MTCGFEHCVALTAAGKVLSWGYGAAGCLGHGNTASYTAPKYIASLCEQTLLYIESGGYHTAAVAQSGELWVWGRGDVHQLGVPLDTLLKDNMGCVALSPVPVQELGCTVKTVACGEAHTLALDSSGVLSCFGWGEEGQLGLCQLNASLCTHSVQHIHFAHKVVQVSAGALFSACLTEYGQIFVWGSGAEGQLGLGTHTKRSSTPSLVNALRDECVIEIACGEDSMMCVCQSGRIYGWGKGLAGDFQDDQLFPTGSAVTCSLPRELQSVQNAHRFLGKVDS